MLTIFAISVGIAASLLMLLAANALSPEQRGVRRRLDEVKVLGNRDLALIRRRRNEERRERISTVLQEMGQRIERHSGASPARDFLSSAGYRSPNAPAIYWGLRFFLLLSVFGGSLLLVPALGLSPVSSIAAAVYFGAIAWMIPVFVVRAKRNTRHRDIRRGLPDVLDMMVVCVEAGLGLNQAFVRVAQESQETSPILSSELLQTNLEIRAGVARDTALRNLSQRTDARELQSLTAMLIQTDRFGTSIAQALRVHSDSMRLQRRQSAEEAAAKTTIKMIFPLVFCIFPAIFVVILGPGIMQFIQAFGGGE